MSAPDVLYIQLNDWVYPKIEPFNTWLSLNLNKSYCYQFDNEIWVKEQKLCVQAFPVEMSITFYITALKNWVEITCPILLNDPKYIKEFLCVRNKDGVVYGDYSDVVTFLPYTKENIGIHFPDKF